MPRTHARLRRLHVAAPLGAGQAVTLDGRQVNHLGAVSPSKPGEALVLFNGRDGAWLSDLIEISIKSGTVICREQIAPQPVPTDLWYGFAPLETGRLDYMVQKATEMGVGSLQPILTHHTRVTGTDPESLRTSVIAAAEQCEVLQVPEILPEIRLESLLAQWPDVQGDRVLIFADEGMAPSSPLAQLQALEGRHIGLIVGPEAGFSDKERDLLRTRPYTVPVSLGPRILRADTAAVAALALIQSIIGDWR